MFFLEEIEEIHEAFALGRGERGAQTNKRPKILRNASSSIRCFDDHVGRPLASRAETEKEENAINQEVEVGETNGSTVSMWDNPFQSYGDINFNFSCLAVEYIPCRYFEPKLAIAQHQALGSDFVRVDDGRWMQSKRRFT